MNRKPARPRWYVPIAVLCAPMPVLLPMYGAGESFRILLITFYLLGIVSSVAWLRSAHRGWARVGVGMLLAWYLLPLMILAVGKS